MSVSGTLTEPPRVKEIIEALFNGLTFELSILQTVFFCRQSCWQRANQVLHKEVPINQSLSALSECEENPAAFLHIHYTPITSGCGPNAALYYTPSLLEMCITKLSKHPKCGHWSCEIKEPCKEGRDFSNCSSFTNGKARNAAKYPQELAKEKTCPKCNKNNEYDGKKIRMVKGSVHATKIGFGPSVSCLLRPFPFCPCCIFKFGERDSWDLFTDLDVVSKEKF